MPRDALPSALVDLVFARAGVTVHRAPNTRSVQLFRKAFATHAGATLDRQHGLSGYGISDSMLKSRNPFMMQPKRLNQEKKPADPLADWEQKVEALEKSFKSQTVLETDSFSEDDLVSFYEDVMRLPTDISVEQLPALPEPTSLSVDTDTTISNALTRLGSIPAAQDPLPNEDPWVPEFAASSDERRQLLSHLHRLLDRAQSIKLDMTSYASSQETVQEPLSTTLDYEPVHDVQLSEEISEVPAPSFVTKGEMEALYHSFMAERDTQALEVLLTIAPQAGTVFSEEAVDAVMEIHADNGSPTSLEAFISKFITSPSPNHRHLHIKSYIRALPSGSYPSEALTLLHDYETQNTPAPMKSYNGLISSLFRVQEDQALARTRAWDLYAHMRYVAHPEPDVQMYTTMIRACASPVYSGRFQSDPHRALDLWTEMTVDKKLEPTAGAYDAIILACTRSGDKTFVDHGFKMVREMLDGHRDAYGKSAFNPSRRTFVAMLDGLRRLGDLSRVRWILAEMARLVVANPGLLGSAEKGELDIDEDVMTFVFHAYASYRIPKQAKLKEVRAPKVSPENQDTAAPARSDVPATSAEASSSQRPLFNSSSDPISSFTPRLFSTAPHDAPQNAREVLAEVRLLFERILIAQTISADTSPTWEEEGRDVGAEEAIPHLHKQGKLDYIFRHVKLTPKLVNAFLHVHYTHSKDIREAREVFNRVYSPSSSSPSEEVDGLRDVKSNVESYIDALERCALQWQKGAGLKDFREREAGEEVALEWAHELWEKFQREFEPALASGLFGGQDGQGRIGSKEARLIERAWVAWIKVLTMSYRLTKALAQVGAFVTRYPHNLVKHTSPTNYSPSSQTNPTAKLYKGPDMSTRTILTPTSDLPARPLVKMQPTNAAVDSYVPPLLTFGDVKDLHHALVTSDHQRSKERIKKEVGFLKWVCKGYEFQLRLRRRRVLEAGVKKGKTGVVVDEIMEEGEGGEEGMRESHEKEDVETASAM